MINILKNLGIGNIDIAEDEDKENGEEDNSHAVNNNYNKWLTVRSFIRS